MAPVYRWNPTFGALPAADEGEYQKAVPSRECIPAANGRPLPAPYAYRGSDFSLPGEITVTGARPGRLRWREATLLDDPALRWAGLPFSAPRDWLDDYEGDL